MATSTPTVDEFGECIHGLAADWCGMCKATPDVGDLYPEPSETVAEAVYDGHCQACNLPIRAGDLIRMWTDDTWRHDDCG